MRQKRLTSSQREGLLSPLTTAIIALRLDSGQSCHYHDVAAQLMIAYRIAELTPRHRHLLPSIQAGINSMSDIFERQDRPTKNEIDSIDLSTEIYSELLKTTSYQTVRRALLNVNDTMKQ